LGKCRYKEIFRGLSRIKSYSKQQFTMARPQQLVDTFDALLEASDQIAAEKPSAELLEQIITSAIVRPNQNESLGYWFARFLSVRQSLWELINECLENGERLDRTSCDTLLWSHFLIGYAAACLLIRNDQLFLFDVAKHSVLQRKFNEAFAEYRIPRKQYTRIFSAFTDGRDALRIYDAIRLAKKNRSGLDRLCDDSTVGTIAARITEFESWLNPSKRTYLQRLLAYVSHKWRRKGIVALNGLLSNASENAGRAASEIKLPLKKRVPVELRESMTTILEPGDILVTRHNNALTNLFLPGFWPHAALYVGTVEQREKMGIEVSSDITAKWGQGLCVFEALKDGLHFRAIADTLAVDSFVALRTQLAPQDIKSGIERVVRHEGKLYNFDFDFFSSDRLVCSEVVYRAFDGLGGLHFPLKERVGRQTLSPEDLLEFALSTEQLSILGIYGVDDSRNEYISGEQATTIARNSIGINLG